MKSVQAIILCLCLVLPRIGCTEILLDTAFRDNMVLQRGPQTVLSGKATANHWVSAFYVPPGKSRPESRPVAFTNCYDTGDWSLFLDLHDARFSTPFGLILRESEEKKGRKRSSPDVALTNLVAADVWLLADQINKGRPADKNDCYSDPAEWGRLRFLDLTGNKPLQTAFSQDVNEWEGYPTNNPGRFSALVMRLAPVLAENTHYVGVVLLTPADLRAVLGPAPRLMDKLTKTLRQRWKGINALLISEQADRWRQRLEAKREGRVVSIPPIMLYDLPSAFYPVHPSNSPPSARFVYVAAILPQSD